MELRMVVVLTAISFAARIVQAQHQRCACPFLA
jgi:hypothetical protein